MTDEQKAHDLAVAIILNRKIDTPAEAYEEYQVMYRDIYHRLTGK